MMKLTEEYLNSFIGQRFGKLTVKEYIGYYKISENKNKYHWFVCICDCENTKICNLVSLKNGDNKSCGCLQYKPKHGYGYHLLYKRWCDIIRRCYNSDFKQYKDYGGRGIEVCEEWHDVEAFCEWGNSVGLNENNMTIERIDVNGNYCPENCTIADMKQQNNNKRNNRKITYKNETKNLNEWAEILGIDRRLLSNRIDRLNWSVEKAFSTKVTHIKTKEFLELEYNNKTQQLSDWCKDLNMKYDVIYRRIKNNWSVKKAFETPIKGDKNGQIS